jgi:ABC-type nitrate/sulfonate/bicarbonate transport system substrate-binding protein
MEKRTKLPCRKRFIRWGIVFGLGAVILTACPGKTEKSTAPPEKITIAYSTAPNAVLFHIAYIKGFFSAEGLHVIPQAHEFGKLALDSLIEGKADLATQSDTVFMFAVTAGKQICSIAMISTSNRATAIVARKDRGIAGALDLKGKKIGVPRGTTGEFFLDSFLSTERISRQEVEIIDLRPNDMTDALLQKRVDAVSVWNPALKKIQKELGEKGIVFYDETLYSDIFCVAARQEFVKKNPEAVKRVLRAFIRAETFVKQNPDESCLLVAEFVKTDKALLDEIWHLYDFKVTLEQSLLVSLEDQTRWAQRNKLTSGTEMLNYLEFIYIDGLRSVNPEAVKIIR